MINLSWSCEGYYQENCTGEADPHTGEYPTESCELTNDQKTVSRRLQSQFETQGEVDAFKEAAPYRCRNWVQYDVLS